MLFSLAILFLVGFSAAAIFQKIGLPRMIGMIATGIVTGPYVLDLLVPSLLGISSELRQIHYFNQGRTLSELIRFKKSRTACCNDVLCAGQL